MKNVKFNFHGKGRVSTQETEVKHLETPTTNEGEAKPKKFQLPHNFTINGRRIKRIYQNGTMYEAEYPSEESNVKTDKPEKPAHEIYDGKIKTCGAMYELEYPSEESNVKTDEPEKPAHELYGNTIKISDSCDNSIDAIHQAIDSSPVAEAHVIVQNHLRNIMFETIDSCKHKADADDRKEFIEVLLDIYLQNRKNYRTIGSYFIEHADWFRDITISGLEFQILMELIVRYETYIRKNHKESNELIKIHKFYNLVLICE